MLRALRNTAAHRTSAAVAALLFAQLLTLSSAHIGHDLTGASFASPWRAVHADTGPGAFAAAGDAAKGDTTACPVCIAAGHARAHSSNVAIAGAPSAARSAAPRRDASPLASSAPWAQIAPRAPPGASS